MITPIPYTFKYFYSEFVFVHKKVRYSFGSCDIQYSDLFINCRIASRYSLRIRADFKFQKNLAPVDDVTTGS